MIFGDFVLEAEHLGDVLKVGGINLPGTVDFMDSKIRQQLNQPQAGVICGLLLVSCLHYGNQPYLQLPRLWLTSFKQLVNMKPMGESLDSLWKCAM